MTETPRDEAADEPIRDLTGLATSHSGSTYKVLGTIDDPGGVGILGHSTATSGQGRGVKGIADSSDDATGVLGVATAGEADGVIGIAEGGGIGVGGAATGGYGLFTPDDARVDGVAELATLGGSLTGGTALTNIAGRGLEIDGDGNLDGHTYETFEFTESGDTWGPITGLSEEIRVEVTVDTSAASGTVNLYVDDVRVEEVTAGSVVHRIVAPTSDVVLDASDVVSSNGSLGLHPDSGALEDIAFKGDGTKVFMCGRQLPQVYSYTLSPGWDLNNETFQTSLDVSGQDSWPLGLAFSGDGTTMYVSGFDNSSVYAYTLSTAWDLSTASFDSDFYVGGQTGFPEGVTFRDDGTSMFVVDSDESIYSYTLSTAWDLSTATFDSSFDLSGVAGQLSGITFNSDGSSLYVCDRQHADVYVSDLSTAWDISSATFEKDSIEVASHESEPTGVSLHSDDTTLFVCGSNLNLVYSFDRLPLSGSAYASVQTDQFP